jgi:coenzyme F420 hydrogenase subunit beta
MESGHCQNTAGHDLVELAKIRGLLEFREVPEGNLERLKQASQNKKKTAIKNLIKKSHRSSDFVFGSPGPESSRTHGLRCFVGGYFHGNTAGVFFEFP